MLTKEEDEKCKKGLFSPFLGKKSVKKSTKESSKSRGLYIGISQKTNCRRKKKSQKLQDFPRDN